MGKVFIHPSAIVDEGAQIGDETRVWHFAHVMPQARIGRGCNVGMNVFIDSQAIVGDHVKLQNNVSVYNQVTLEDGVFCGPSAVFTNVINPRSRIERKTEYRRTLVKQNATIGANATVVCGVTIGRAAMIGAGSVVTRDIPDYALAYGNPARVRGWVCECGVKLELSAENGLTCSHCGASYVRDTPDHVTRSG
jgi:UDP-2-acetamido-3-amino-2,3-dideoxy-glucuronate N-acetyltransferase